MTHALRKKSQRACRPILIGVLLALFTLVAPAALRADGPVSLDAYRQAIAQALTLTQQANTIAPNERAPLLNQAAAALAPITSVRLSNGTLTPVNNANLVTLIRDPAKTSDALARLTALKTVAAGTPVPAKPADLAALQTMLSRAPYATDTSEPWYQLLLDQFLAFLNRLLDNTSQGVFQARDIFVLLGILVVIGVVAFLIRNLRRNLVTEQELPFSPFEEQVRTPNEAFANAQQFINAGDYRSAVRQLYLATLLILDQHGKLKFDPTLTNREYLRQASADPRTGAALRPIVETFDRTWYGFKPISPEEFADYQKRVEQVREL